MPNVTVLDSSQFSRSVRLVKFLREAVAIKAKRVLDAAKGKMSAGKRRGYGGLSEAKTYEPLFGSPDNGRCRFNSLYIF